MEPIIVTNNFLSTLITTGMGGGAIGVALIGLFGGYAFSGFGARWTRRVSGFQVLLLIIASIFPVCFTNQAAATPSTSKVFGALLFVLLMIVLITGVSIPSRYQSRNKK